MADPTTDIRISLVGRQHVVLDSLRHLINLEPDLKVVDASVDGSSVTAPERPDLALFDLDDADDESVLDALRATAATARTIVLSISADPPAMLTVFQCGAVGLVSRRDSPEVLLTAIRKVHAGEAWLARAMAAQVLDLARAERQNQRRAVRPADVPLTARDRELITLVGEGWRNADIARHLAASEATIRANLTAIFRKLGLPGRFALMIYASQHGFVSADNLARRQVPVR